jgi:hypothetical protein
MRVPRSRNQGKPVRGLARMHARIVRLRRDLTHKLTTRLCRETKRSSLNIRDESRKIARQGQSSELYD